MSSGKLLNPGSRGRGVASWHGHLSEGISKMNAVLCLKGHSLSKPTANICVLLIK